MIPFPSPLPSSYLLRHLQTPLKTTIKLEKAFFDAQDFLAAKRGQSWQAWALAALEDKPDGVGMASWLRIKALQQITPKQRKGRSL